MSGKSAATWHMLVADDFLLEAGESDYRFAILSFFILAAVLGVPLSWHKTLGGDVLVWVGFELLLESRKDGISQRRAEWFVRWSSEVASVPTVHMRSFEEGLGRIMFVAGALEYERPFLGPLYKFLTMHPRDSVRRVPPYVAFILEFLSRTVLEDRHYDCNEFLVKSGVAPRVDAQASDSRTGIGGGRGGSRMLEPMVKSICGSLPGSPWRYLDRRSPGSMSEETNLPCSSLRWRH